MYFSCQWKTSKYYHREICEGEDDTIGDVKAESSCDDKEDDGEGAQEKSGPNPVEHAE